MRISKKVLDRFPKERSILPEEYQNIYESHYKINREGLSKVTNITRKMEGWMHKMVAKDVNGDCCDGIQSTLEIGAGTLNQLDFEHYSDDSIYDVIEPLSYFYNDSPHKEKVTNFFMDVSDVPSTNKYNRITAIATFEHLCDLPSVVARSGLLLKEKGCLRIAIPSEGTLLWTLGYKLTTGIEYKMKYGLNYSVLMKHEHVNTAKEIQAVLKYFFSDVRCKVFGLSRKLSFYQFFDCRNPKSEECLKY